MKESGFAIVPKILSCAQAAKIGRLCDGLEVEGAGARNLMSLEWIRELSSDLLSHPTLRLLLPENAVSVQCTYFRKTDEANWLVPLHRDQSIPVQLRFESDHWHRWSLKEGVWYVQPPQDVLESLMAVRIHLEANSTLNGPLQVVPGSHIDSAVTEPREVCEVPSGGALVMSPLLLHASSKSSKGQRRVLHFLYGPKKLPSPARWAYAR